VIRNGKWIKSVTGKVKLKTLEVLRLLLVLLVLEAMTPIEIRQSGNL
jgi:hypothetical protein